MNIIKRSLAIVLVAIMAFSFCGCHKKGEIAIKVGDINFSSAYYMCALISADMSARQQIDSKAQTDDSIDTSKEGYYYSQKIDGKKFETYVKDTALDNLKELASFKIKANEAKLKIDDNTENNVKAYVSYYWTSGGYSEIFENNGVSKETFTEYFRDSYYSELYFNHLYGKDGEKAISDADITKFRSDNYCLADVLSADLSSKEDAEKNAVKTQFNTFFEDIKKDPKSFKAAYEAVNNIEDANKQDSYATIVGSSKSSNPNDDFDTIKAMANNEVKLIEAKDGSKISIVVKHDLASDSEKIENLDSEIRHSIKDEEFSKDMEAFQKTLKLEEIKSATKQFNIKKIEYPQSSQN